MHRDKALATISADGILLVLASMIDNMPYVLAEASVMRIPLLIYDVGGVTEMIDPKQHADIICGTPKVGPSRVPKTSFTVNSSSGMYAIDGRARGQASYAGIGGICPS